MFTGVRPNTAMKNHLKTHTVAPGGPSPVADEGPGPALVSSTDERRPGPSEAPEPEPQSLFGRLIGAKEKAPKEPTTTPKEVKPRASFRRQSTATVFEFAWSQGGMALVATGRDVPVGRVLALQAPMVGDVLDDAIKGTFVDKAIQPFMRQGQRAKMLGAVLGPPLVVAALERNPELAPTLIPMLRAFLMPMLVEVAKAAKKAKADEKKLLDALEDLGDVLPPEMRREGVNPVDAIIESIFAPPPAPPAANNGAAPSEEPEPFGMAM